MDKVSTYRINPSLPKYGEGVREFKRTLRSKDSREGIVDGNKAVIYNDERVLELEDTVEYIKLTKAGAELLPVLNSHGITVLSYIMQYCLEFNRDIIVLIGKNFTERMRVSLSTFSRGIKNLVENEFIYKTDKQSIYWINLTMFHKGNMEDKYKEFVHTIMR